MTYKGPGRKRTRERVQERSSRLRLDRALDQQLDDAIGKAGIGIRCHIGDHQGCSVGSWCDCDCHHSDPLDDSHTEGPAP